MFLQILLRLKTEVAAMICVCVATVSARVEVFPGFGTFTKRGMARQRLLITVTCVMPVATLVIEIYHPDREKLDFVESSDHRQAHLQRNIFTITV